ncbi:MAG TPA: ABC transporter substrate binding protein, partial [Gammaproteobacteria bacterium]|nr:ABC transporter substrate binding protein [Gammaproteobacteria bacterium]
MLKKLVLISALATGVCLPGAPAAAPHSNGVKVRVVVVSSYHREYLWSQDTNAGVTAALLDFGYLENEEQGKSFWQDDYVESSKAVVRKLWMDTKRRNRLSEIADSVARIIGEIEEFGPDIILLGDDNAANYVGSHYLDTELPVVFWGINGTPMKYGLLESMERPGHNITGIYQAGYLREGLVALKTLLPEVKSFAVLSDDSPTGRAKAKEFLRWGRRGELPLELIDVVVTNEFEIWKRRALELQERVDVFFVL